MYILFTDTDCEITPKKAKELNCNIISMPFTMDGKEIYPYQDFEVFNAKEYYDKLRAGATPKTSGISPEAYLNYFEPHMKDGNDILYVHFSEAISGTFNAMRIAIEQLKEKYPERKVEVIDTKAISVMSLMFVEKASQMLAEGKTVEEIKAWVEAEINHYAMYFFVEDLTFFARSGRVKAFSALLGNILGIRPIIYLNPEGSMENIEKIRGKNATISKVLEYVRKKQDNLKDHKVYIGHTDTKDSAETIAQKLRDEYGDVEIEFMDINPTIGAHCGPGCVGVAFHAKER